MLCFFACHSDTPLFTCQQINEQLEIIKTSGRINKWYTIVKIVSPEDDIEEIITVEKSRTDEFNVTYFIHTKDNNDNIRYKKNQKVILKNNKKYEIIRNIEKINTKLSTWSGQIILDGYYYELEINSIDAKTIMILSEISFESGSGMEPIKTWIDNVRSLKK